MIFLIVFLLFVPLVQANTLEVVFEHNPPFQMVDSNGIGYGPVYDFTKILTEHTDLPVQYHSKPWSRIMLKDAKIPNKLIMSISKTPQRLAHFIWLTSVYKGQQFIWKKRDSQDSMNKDLHVSVERGSHKAKSIYEHFHADNVFEFVNSTQALHALLKGRVNRFVGTTFAVSGKLNTLGYELNVLDRVSKFDESGFASQGLYLALTPNTSNEVILTLQKALTDPEVIDAQNKLVMHFKQAEKQLLSARKQ